MVVYYFHFPLSLRNVEDLLHERGIDASHEAEVLVGQVRADCESARGSGADRRRKPLKLRLPAGSLSDADPQTPIHMPHPTASSMPILPNKLIREVRT